MTNELKQDGPVPNRPMWVAVLLAGLLAGLTVAAVDVALYLAGVEDLKGPVPSLVRAIAIGVGVGLGLTVVRRRKRAEQAAAADRPRD